MVFKAPGNIIGRCTMGNEVVEEESGIRTKSGFSWARYRVPKQDQLLVRSRGGLMAMARTRTMVLTMTI